jgi:SAM-dependent methyltransferase
MILQAYLGIVRWSLLLAVLLPFIAVSCSWVLGGLGAQPVFWVPLAALAALGVVGARGLGATLVARCRPALERLGEEQTEFLGRLTGRTVPLAIAASAGASLLLELAVIRWQGTEWQVFALYKNFSLLACFLGLGLGYALARAPQIPAVLVLPLLALKVVYLLLLRHGPPPQWTLSLHATPILEQLNLGVTPATEASQYVAVFALLALVVLLTALIFVPVGQLCGRLLDRLPRLEAYGWNLAGSLGGVGLMFGLSFLWAPPLAWFAVPAAVLLWLQGVSRGALLAGLAAFTVLLAALGWPAAAGWERIYSPYQLLERGPGERGLSLIRAASTYHQWVHDLSPGAVAAFPERRARADYYGLPYRLRPGARRVAIVGAGTGNDVAAALRGGAAAVDAVEIDPAILHLGQMYHPERPYADPRVRPVVDDARSFLRGAEGGYDLIVYGLLDSHTLLSHTSSVRLDSYVYTVEALREARARLAPGGVLSLSFAVISPELGRKIHLMMEAAFDGQPPVSIDAQYEAAVIFAQSREGDLRVEPALLAGTGFHDRTRFFADPAIRADVSTDDWPFFYMPRRVYPQSYLWAVALVLAISLWLYRGLVRARPDRAGLPFFFLGAGFMLVETKGITELGLVFGNTWQVVGIVIAAILVLAWLGNRLVLRHPIRRAWVPWLLLLLSLAAGLVFVQVGGLDWGGPARGAAVLLLTLPLFFSGIVFSTLMARSSEASSALGMNLLGAMAGGVLEYNSMYFGFQSLYWLAAALYGVGLLLYLLPGRLDPSHAVA